MASEKRRKQVAREIQQRVANLLLFEMKDPRLTSITVTGVEVNADLTLARIRYSVLGTEGQRGAVAVALEHAHGFIRREVARVVRLRLAPQIVFEYDPGAEQAERIEQLLREVLPQREQPGPSETAGAEADDEGGATAAP